jgi:hypothetical protein
MQLPKGSGLEVLDRLAARSIKYYSGLLRSDSFKENIRTIRKFYSANNLPAVRLPSLKELRKPVESIMRGLNSISAQLNAKPEKIDYNAVVNNFLPPGARLVKPQYPENSAEIQFADLDGDGRSELVTSYMTGDDIRTLVLKRDPVQWYKMAEISNPGTARIHYRNTADISGDGKSNLLLGLESGQQDRTLYAYSVSDGGSIKIFSKKYDKLELVRTRGASGRIKDACALWHETAPGIFDIELVHWNGIDLESLDKTRYLSGKVLPYYIRKLRQDPGDTRSWYNLADTFMKTGDKTRAEMAVRYGLQHDPDPQTKERFSELQRQL